MPPWRRPAVNRTEKRGSLAGRDRCRLESGLRQYYASAIDECWDPETEERIHARVSRAMATQRSRSDAPRRKFRLTRVGGPHVAAVVCAGAAVIAFGNWHGAAVSSPSNLSPTSAPLNGHPTRSHATTRLSLVGNRTSNNLARPI
jgi:hypothetical protein